MRLVPVGLKKHSYLVKYKNDPYLKTSLYKKCWKNKSTVFIDPYKHCLAAHIFVRHSVNFQDGKYGRNGFQILKFQIYKEYITDAYMSYLTDIAYTLYSNDMDVSWITDYVWWFKEDDESGKLHDYWRRCFDDNIDGEIIDFGDIILMKIIRNDKDKPSYLRGRALRQFLIDRCNDESNRGS